MGSRMVKHLLDAGNNVVVYDSNQVSSTVLALYPQHHDHCIHVQQLGLVCLPAEVGGMDSDLTEGTLCASIRSVAVGGLVYGLLCRCSQCNSACLHLVGCSPQLAMMHAVDFDELRLSCCHVVLLVSTILTHSFVAVLHTCLYAGHVCSWRLCAPRMLPKSTTGAAGLRSGSVRQTWQQTQRSLWC